MLDALKSLPKDPDELRDLVVLLSKELQGRDMKIAKLEHQLRGQLQHRFGSKSESLEQLNLFVENLEIAEAAEAPEPVEPTSPETKVKPKRKPLPEHLHRNETVLSPGEDCAECGGSLKALGEDVTEELEYVPGRFIVNKFVRPRMACSCCDAIAREGIDLDRSTLAGWVGKSTALLELLGDAIARHVKAGQALFADDTPIKMQDPGARKTKTARIWTYVRDERPWVGDAPPAAWYQFTIDRKGEHPVSHLDGYKGWVHADGYAGFNGVFGDEKASEVACMAHVSTCGNPKQSPCLRIWKSGSMPSSHGSREKRLSPKRSDIA